ncbi:hypothetical protein NKDENANG_00516 [Candidatus Entotheonellaceae bacterium PAL068K]
MRIRAMTIMATGRPPSRKPFPFLPPLSGVGFSLICLLRPEQEGWQKAIGISNEVLASRVRLATVAAAGEKRLGGTSRSR